MKTKTKALLISMCAIMLVAATVFGTMAYLTSTPDPVTNTFSVGKVEITLDEAKVDEYGKKIIPEERVKSNRYKLLPGCEYDKDPTVHVIGDSESSWIFVKVVNGIKALEATDADYENIAAQIATNGWEQLNGHDGVYYKEYTKGNSARDLVVFENFKIASDANEKWGENIPAVTITAYAIQKEGLNVEQAWAALNS